MSNLPPNEPANQTPIDETAPEGTIPPLTRRDVLVGGATTLLGLAAGNTIAAPAIPATPQAGMPATSAGATATIPITLNINGKDMPVNVEPRVTLLDALRERLHLTGTKKGCDHGQCGACTVHVNGRRINSCLTLAMMHQGDKITTIEGLANGEALHPMQSAFIAHDGFQCGYCTPGQIMSATALLAEGHAKTDAEIKDSMSGNICRCGAYPNILAAIKDVMGQKTASTATDLTPSAETQEGNHASV